MTYTTKAYLLYDLIEVFILHNVLYIEQSVKNNEKRWKVVKYFKAYSLVFSK